MTFMFTECYKRSQLGKKQSRSWWTDFREQVWTHGAAAPSAKKFVCSETEHGGGTSSVSIWRCVHIDCMHDW